MILRGKNKPQFTPNSDCGDFVVVINADKVQLTGNKANQKVYYRHSGYNGGLKAETFVEAWRSTLSRSSSAPFAACSPRPRLAVSSSRS